MSKLEKCPFCGGEAIFHITSEFTKSCEQGFCFEIKCTRCGITYPCEGKVSVTLEEGGTLRYIEDNRLELMTKWNSRKGCAKSEEIPKKVDSHAEYWDNIGSENMRGDE